MNDPYFLLTLSIIFAIAGMVKGVIGLGLPTISLALVTAVADLKTAMAILLIPSAITNLWQALGGGGTVAVLALTWRFLAAASALIFVGSLALNSLPLPFLSALLGIVLIVYAAVSIAGARLPTGPARRNLFGIAMGMINGLLTGMTGSFVVPGVMYLQALGLSREHFIQAMGMLFLVSTVVLALALGRIDLLTVDTWMVSFFALFPAIAGMWCGRWIRNRLSDATFRRAFLASLLVLGVYLVSGAAMEPLNKSS